MPNSSTQIRARREPQLAGHLYDLRPVARAPRQQNTHRALSGRRSAAARRRPALYEALGVPDRIDGRFQLLTLHSGLVLRRLAALGGVADPIAQDLVNSLFAHFDDTLREMGFSDIAVAKRLKAMGAPSTAAMPLMPLHSTTARPPTSRRRWPAMFTPTGRVAGLKAEALAHHVALLDAALAAIPIEAFATGRFRFRLARSPPEAVMAEASSFSRLVRVESLPRRDKS